MLQARITSPNGATYIAIEPTPYDLENLYGYAGASATPVETAVELQLSARASHDPKISAELSTLVDRLSGHGVRVRVCSPYTR